MPVMPVTCEKCGRECEDIGKECPGGCGQIIEDRIECTGCGGGYTRDRSDGCGCKK